MAENHYVDPKDQHVAAVGVEDHSELTTSYVSAKKVVLGPWMQEADRQAALEAERDKIQTGLRKSSVLIGLSVSMPVVLGILLGQLAMSKVQSLNAGPLIFLLIVLVLVLIIITVLLFKWVGQRFHKHSIRAIPITLTTLLSLFLVIQKVFDLFQGLIGGFIGYASALVVLVVISIFIATITISVWTSPKVHALAKILILLLFIGISAVIFYLA